MKRYLPFLCGLLLAACSSEFEEEAGAVRGGRAVELTGVSGSSTRTSAGAVDGAAIPFLWSADDRIWVNGVQSSEAGTAGAAASFGFSELTGEAPYEVYYNMTGEGARAVVPSRQNQAAAGELQLGANGDFGYATTDAGGHFTLSHATSYIWFDPWSQEVDARLVSVSLATADRTIALCGTRTFDGGGFGAATGGEYAVTLSFGAEGVALAASGGDTRVFAAAGVYPVDCSATEVHVTYTFADGSVYTETRPGRKLEAGATYRLTSEITKRAGGALEIEAGEADGEPVCLKYGGSEVRSLTAEGWIPQVRTTAPARWTADLNIARRTLRVAPPAEYLEGQDLENTLRIESDGEPLFSQDYYVLDFTHPEGTFVLMEGNMTTENGSIVYFDQHMRYHERVYEEVNDNEIGNVLQDMYMIGGRIDLQRRRPLRNLRRAHDEADPCARHAVLCAGRFIVGYQIDALLAAAHRCGKSRKGVYPVFDVGHGVAFGHPYRQSGFGRDRHDRYSGYLRCLHQDRRHEGAHDRFAREGLRRTGQFGDRHRLCDRSGR